MEPADLSLMTTAQAAARWSRRWVANAIANGELVQLGTGVVVGARQIHGLDAIDQHAVRVKAALLRMSGPAAASYGTAAFLHGLARMGRPSYQVRLTRAGTRYRRLDVDARLHTAGLPDHHVTEVRGVDVTTIARTTVDLARLASFRGGLVVADSALRLGCERPDLERVLRDCRRWPGVRRARRVVEFARAEAETPLESVSRAYFMERGLPSPELQVRLLDGDGVVRRADFYWAEFRTVGESDGMLKYDEPNALRAEKLRQEALEDAGFIVVRWTWNELWRYGDEIERRLRRAFARTERRSA